MDPQLDTGWVSLVLAALICGFVAFLTVTRKDAPVLSSRL
jgi:hypothetical protein